MFYKTSPTRARRKAHDDAVAWLFPDAVEGSDFERVCDLLDRTPESVQDEVRRLKPENLEFLRRRH